ncbi:MAG: class I SAM-dependent DNA methyltransferase [Ideonella sp.]|nr:class I SAM-dependent DNA methyltransferase [Ideonella sp.]MCC7459621.1 class I SAM-dependent DNA methyltransferase [Nitrospira sp.]
MQAAEFVRKWQAGSSADQLNERAGAQPHFIDLCRVLGVPEPDDPGAYCFERGLSKTGSAAGRTDGFADVWKRGHFAWEYKAPGKSLEGALKQLMMYALPLENPPLLVVSDRRQIEVHTHFTGTPSERHAFALSELVRPEVQQRLRALWLDPDAYRPKRSNRDITEDAARTFAATAERLRAAGVAPAAASHFLTQCLFCFFAEDVGLLPSRLFERLVGAAVAPEALRAQLSKLFESMRDGGLFGVDAVPWFNGGLFQAVDVPPLAAADVAALKAASALNWSAIDPSIFGTLFERGLDPAKRSQLGAHYTDPQTILRLVEPVVQRPLLAQWRERKVAIEKALARSKKYQDKAWRDAQAGFVGFVEQLGAYRVLDPACGSGNFLYLAHKSLKDIEHQVNLEAEELGLNRQHDTTGPHNVLGIELNEYAAELARVTVWIGELQWRIQRGYGFKTQPVLEPLDHIECRDALLNADGSEARWPKADAVVGNPPFVGDKRMFAELGREYTHRLRSAYTGRVPGGADLVCYWFEQARAQIARGALERAGFVATNSIRGGRNRAVLENIAAASRIFEAWSDEPWINDGAAVRVSLVAFGTSAQPARLDGVDVEAISPDLSDGHTGGQADLTRASPLLANADTSYLGIQKTGPFEIPGDVARGWLALPNPNGRPNSDVVRPWFNGLDVTRRNRDMWIVDFGADMARDSASLYEQPFLHLQTHVQPTRTGKREARTNEQWWLYQWSRPLMRAAIKGLQRCVATPEVSKHRVFVWLAKAVIADKNLSIVAREDDTTFGILHGRMHELWSLRMCTWLGKGNDPRYTPTTCFETFPFPTGLTPADTAHQRTEALPDGALVPADLPAPVRAHAEAIARAARRLVELRDAWLNPPQWTERIPEVVPLGLQRSPYPDRIVAKAGFEKEVAKRTLTNLYNQRPAWLAQAHAALDTAVAAAYGWADYTPALADDEILRRLLALNLERSGKT